MTAKNELIFMKDNQGHASMPVEVNAPIHVGDNYNTYVSVAYERRSGDGGSESAERSNDTGTSAEQALCEVVNKNAAKLTKVSIIEDFCKERLKEPKFKFYPQMKKVKDFFRGGFQEFDDVKVKVGKTKYFRRPVKKITKNQMTREVGFHYQQQNNDDETITVEQLMESVTQKIEPLPDQSTPVTAIVASAGSGKTTLMKRLARECVESCVGKQNNDETLPHESETHFKMVHYMDAKNMKFERKTDVSAFLFGGMYRNKDDERKAYEWLIDHESEAILFIDGIDQAGWISSSAQRELALFADCNSAEIMYNLLSRKLLPQLKIVIASREFKVAELPAEARPESNEIVTLVGLDKKDAEKLFICLIGERGEGIWRKIESTAQRLVSILSIPVFLVLTAAIIALDPDSNPPVTMTEIYYRIVLNLCKVKNIQDKKKIMDTLKKLKAMAHQGMMEGRVVFRKEDILQFRLSIKNIQDLMIKVPDNNILDHYILECEFMYFFCHQSLQEFLSASFITEMSGREFSRFNSEHLHESRWAVVRAFVSGIIHDEAVSKRHGVSDRKGKQKVFDQSIRSRVKDEKLDGREGVEILATIYESNDEDLILSLSRLPPVLRTRLGADEAYMFSSIWARRGRVKGEAYVELSNCGLEDEHLEIMARNLRQRKLKVELLSLSGNFFTAKGLNSLLDNLKSDQVRMDYERFGAFRYEDLNWNNIGRVDWFPLEMSHREKEILVTGMAFDASFDKAPRLADTDQRLQINREFEHSENAANELALVRFFKQKFFKSQPAEDAYLPVAALADVKSLSMSGEISKLLLDCRSEKNIVSELIDFCLHQFQVSFLDILVNEDTSFVPSNYLAQIKSRMCADVNVHWRSVIGDDDDISKLIPIIQQHQVENLRLSLDFLSSSFEDIKHLIESCKVKKLTMVYGTESEKTRVHHDEIVKFAAQHDIEVEEMLASEERV